MWVFLSIACNISLKSGLDLEAKGKKYFSLQTFAMFSNLFPTCTFSAVILIVVRSLPYPIKKPQGSCCCELPLYK